MTGIHQLLVAGAASNDISITWPGAPTSGLTTVYGTMRLASATSVPNGTLTIVNTAGNDAAHTYVTALPSAIKDSTQTAKSALLCYEPGLQGLWSRGTVQNSVGTLISGYRFDYLRLNISTASIRIIEANASVLTVRASTSIIGLPGMSYYYNNPAPGDVTFHMTTTTSGADVVISGWLSAPGQTDTPTVTWTDTSATASGRIGFLSFANPPFDNFWSAYSATWTT